MKQILPGRRTVQETLDACRFCWMCRHICPTGVLTSREALTPRGFVLTAHAVRSGVLKPTPDVVDVLQSCVDCRLCTEWCVSRFEPWRAIQAVRADLVEHGHVAAPSLPAPPNGAPPGVADATLFVGTARTSTVAAAQALLAAVSITATVVRGDLGELARALGQPREAARCGDATRAALTATGCTTLLTLSPADTRALRDAAMATPNGPAPADPCLLTTYLAVRPLPPFRDLGSVTVAYHDPCAGERTDADRAAARALLAAMPRGRVVELPWSHDRAQSCGQGGGVPVTQPALARRLAQARLAEARAGGATVLVSEAPECAAHLDAHGGGSSMTVTSLYEFMVERLPC